MPPEPSHGLTMVDQFALDILEGRYARALARAMAGDGAAVAVAEKALDEMDAILRRAL